MRDLPHAEKPCKPTRIDPPSRRASAVVIFHHEGHEYRGTGSFVNGHLVEVFLDVGKCNSTLQGHAADSAILASLLLQYGVGVENITHSVTGPICKALSLLADNG